MIGEMRNRITVKSFTYVKDAGGGTSPVLSSTFTIWAKVEDRTGSAQIIENKPVWNYDYKITIRFNKLRPVEQGSIVEIGTKKMKIQSLQNKQEGKNFYLILRCSTID